MITKDGQNKLRNERPTPGADLTHTPDGDTVQRVHMTTEAHRIGQINRGDRIMSSAAQKLRDNMTFKPLEGRARGPFRHVAPKLTPRSFADRNHQERER